MGKKKRRQNVRHIAASTGSKRLDISVTPQTLAQMAALQKLSSIAYPSRSGIIRTAVRQLCERIKVKVGK